MNRQIGDGPQGKERSRKAVVGQEKSSAVRVLLVVSHVETNGTCRIRHSGLDPESSGATLDPVGFRRDDVAILVFRCDWLLAPEWEFPTVRCRTDRNPGPFDPVLKELTRTTGASGTEVRNSRLWIQAQGVFVNPAQTESGEASNGVPAPAGANRFIIKLGESYRARLGG